MVNTTLVNKENQREVDEVLDIVRTMNSEEKRKLIVFLQGARFAKELNDKNNIKANA